MCWARRPEALFSVVCATARRRREIEEHGTARRTAAFLNGRRLVVIVEQNRFELLAHVPFDVIGQHA
jgi:hypothetical protein